MSKVIDVRMAEAAAFVNRSVSMCPCLSARRYRYSLISPWCLGSRHFRPAVTKYDVADTSLGNSIIN